MQRVTKIINESEILKNGKDNPAVFGLSVVESQGNITLASKSSYRGSQYDMLSDLRKSNADAIFVWFGVCSLLFLFLFFFFFSFVKRNFRFYHLVSIAKEKPDSNWFIGHFVIKIVSTVSVVILLITVLSGPKSSRSLVHWDRIPGRYQEDRGADTAISDWSKMVSIVALNRTYSRSVCGFFPHRICPSQLGHTAVHRSCSVGP